MSDRYLVIEQICCAINTQFANRMNHCEDSGHTAAGYAACVGDHCPAISGMFSGNLDGIVKVTYGSKKFIPNSETLTFIGNDKNYISDHNGVDLVVDARREDRPEAFFNIITHNLEGLCYRKDPKKLARFQYVREHLVPYFEGFVHPGSIMLIQELALQLHKKDLDQQQIVLSRNMNILLTELQKLNPNIIGQDDGYTGGIFYDRTYWSIINEVRVKRQGSNKFSNGYLMQFLPYPDLKLWVVNIHLKAYGNAMKSQTTVNRAHINELSAIMEQILKANRKEEYPIYFCGDFNNGTVKAELIMEAAKQVALGYQLYFVQPPQHSELSESQQSLLLQALEE